MIMKILQFFLILAVVIAAILAFYLRTPLTIEHQNSFSTFILSIDTKKPSHFGILGEGRNEDFTDESFNSTVLKKHLETLKNKKVKAIFFDGNLVSGVKKGEDEHSKPVNNEKLNLDLHFFSKLYDNVFTYNVPFYPVLGNCEILIPNSAQAFIHHFHLNGALILDDSFLYTVAAGHAFFAIIATDELNKEGNNKVEPTFSAPMLEWLDKVLIEASKRHKYLFVVGYEPAYPSTTTYSKDHLPQRDAFWQILKNHKVLAYFSSKEHLFDRSYRSGVWQIISGGAGAPLSQGGGTQPFFHSLVLTIPGDKKEKAESPTNPKIQVLDSEGKVVEEFNISSDNQPLYQMRISMN